MDLVIGATLYFTFCAYLILPHLGAPPIFGRMLIGLCASEFVVAFAWAFSRPSCGGDLQCPEQGGVLADAVGLQIPLIAAGVFVVAGAYAIFVVRRW